MHIWKAFLNNLYSIKLWGGYIAIGDLSNRARSSYAGATKNIKVGSIVLRRSEGFIGNIFSSSRVSHSGLYLGEYGHYKRAVIHAAGKEGVIIDELYEFLDVNYVEVWNNTHPFTKADEKNFVDIAVKHLGESYDYGFNPNNNRYYCTELVAKIYEQFNGLMFKKEKTFFKMTYKPDTFIPENEFIMVFAHDYYGRKLPQIP